MTKTWNYLKESEAEKSEAVLKAANQTLTLTVDKMGNFVYTDMGDPEIWNLFCKRAGLEL